MMVTSQPSTGRLGWCDTRRNRKRRIGNSPDVVAVTA